MRILFIALAAVTTVTLLAINVAAYFGDVLYDGAPWIALIVFPGIFIPWTAFIVHGRKRLGLRTVGERRSDAANVDVSSARGTWSGSMGWLMRLVRVFPVWARCMIAANYAYFFGLLLSMSSVHGQATNDDGKFVLRDGSRFARYLTESEYRSMHAHDALVMSGCALIFSVVPLLFFLAGARDDQRPRESTK